MPVDTIPTCCGVGCIIVGFDVLGPSFGSTGLDFLTEVDLETTAEDKLVAEFDAGADSTFVIGGVAKASSARASTTRLESEGSGGVSV